MSEALQKILYDACWNGHEQVVYRNLLLGADPNKRANDGATPLWLAAHNGHEGVVHALLNAGADHQAAKDGTTPLMLAAQKGHTRVVLALLEWEDNLKLRGNYCQTPLHIVACNDEGRIQALLVNRRGDPDVVNNDEMLMPAYWDREILIPILEKTLGFVAATRNESVLRIFLGLGANPTKSWLLQGATERGQEEVVRALLELKANPHIRNADTGFTPLYVAASHGYEKVVRTLVAWKADPNNSRDNVGMAPLHVAARGGHETTVGALLQLKADPHAIMGNNQYSTPLSIAILNGHEKVVRALIEWGVDPNPVIDNYDEDPSLSYAAQRGHVHVVRLLLNSVCRKNLFTENLSRNEAYLPILKDLLDIATTDPLSENLLSCLLTEPYRSYYLQSELKAARGLCESAFDACSQGVYPEGWLIGDVISLKVQAAKIVVTHLPQKEWMGNYLPKDLEELCFAYYFLMQPEETNGEKVLIEEIQSENVSLEKIKVLLELSQRKLDVYLPAEPNVYLDTPRWQKRRRHMFSHLLKMSIDLKKTAVRDVFLDNTSVLNEICKGKDIEVLDALLKSATEREIGEYCERINSTSSDYGRFFSKQLRQLNLRQNPINTNSHRLVASVLNHS